MQKFLLIAGRFKYKLSEAETIEKFLKGLKPELAQQLNTHMAGRDWDRFTDLTSTAVRMDQKQWMIKKSAEVKPKASTSRSPSAKPNQPQRKQNKQNSGNRNNGNNGSQNAGNNRNNTGGGQKRRFGNNRGSNNRNHNNNNNNNRNKGNHKRPREENKNSGSSNPVCFNCNKPGHLAKDCRSQKKSKTDNRNQQSN